MPQPGGQRHLHFGATLAVLVLADLAAIDQAEFDDVDRDFRIEAGAQLRPHRLFDFVVAGVVGQFRQRHRLLADRVRVFVADAEQIAFDEDGEAAAQGLGDIAGLARRQIHEVARGHHDGGAVALEADWFTGLRITGHGDSE
jgi:hypothetical protein